MSTRLDGGGGRGREFFLSAHRCPEVDLLPHHDSETVKSPEFTGTGQSQMNSPDGTSTCCSEEEEEKELEEEEGSISDWSEEDLSLHFSPSVILPSDDEESDPESGFECVDITVETLVNGQEREGLKMVPKRQIQLKKKRDAENIINKEKTEKQVILKDGPAEGRIANSEVSANELLCPTVHHYPDLLLRQHSMPASLHAHSTTSSDVDSRGLVAGASQGFQVGGNSRQRLQKSFSLDETKTKMASCIIKSVLSKKMQVEQNNSKTYLQRKPVAVSSLLQPADQQSVRERDGGKTGGGVIKAPVHVVRDIRSLVKNTYSHSFSAPTITPENNNKPTSFKVTCQEESPPPTYQQAVGVKGHDETKRSCQASVYSSSSGGPITKVAASLSQTQDRKQGNRFSHPITQQRQGNLTTNSPVNSNLPELSQSEGTRGVSNQVRTPPPSPVLIQPPPHHPSTSRYPKGTQPLLSAQRQSSILGVSSQFAPSSSQQIFHSCLYTPNALSAFHPNLHPLVGKFSYVQSPMSYIQTQLQPPPHAPSPHLLRRSEENPSGSTGKNSDQPECFIRTCPPHRSRTTGDQESNSNTMTPTTQEQHEQQKRQEFLCSSQVFSPAQVSRDILINMAGSTAAPRALLSGPVPSHIILEPKNGQCLYVDTLPQPQRKMLLDPETGQYVQVFLPAASSFHSAGVFPARCANPALFAPSVINPTPTPILSVMQFQPTVAVGGRTLCIPPCLPFTLHTPTDNFTNTTQ
ncbi:uncharacterized protein LOC143332532 [Chaetodon auriga]|uniref:uncharacterized protein LOC143332532 n=1 Tax=Chaetodon auriga TaxID=39042 RepID=UPI00403288C7